MISPFMVYLVMQADSIVTFFAFTGAVGVLAGGGFYFAASEYGDENVKRLARASFIIGCMFCFVAVFTPTTKTAAAMIVIPALTSDKAVETAAPEMRELYELTKDALKALSGKSENPGKEQ